MSEKQGRGSLTERVKEKSKELLGYEIDKTELRLMPYIQYVLMNERSIDIRKISSDERPILSKWREKGYITGSSFNGISASKEFWDILSELLFLSYVDID